MLYRLSILALVFLLVGCTGSATNEGPSSVPSESAVPSPTPTPSPTPLDPTGMTFDLDPAAWTLPAGWQASEWVLESPLPSGLRFDAPLESTTGGWSSITIYPTASRDYSGFVNRVTEIDCAIDPLSETPIEISIEQERWKSPVKYLSDTLFGLPAAGRTVTYNFPKDGPTQVTQYCLELAGRVLLYEVYEFPALEIDQKAVLIPLERWTAAPAVDLLIRSAQPALISAP